MQMDTSISIYAELLPNIRQVSIAVSLASPTNSSTKPTIRNSAASTSTLYVHHAGSSKSLTLPASVAVPDGYELPILPGRPLEWRLPVNPQKSKAQDEDEVPWEAKDLVAGGRVSCRNCNATLVREGCVEVWKDLPAEGWAEMMEFWHCHKPGDDHGHDHGGHVSGEERVEKDENRERLASRGYGANSAILAHRGIGFVDLTTFLFHEEDCGGVQLPTSGGNETDSAGKARNSTAEGGVIDLTSTSEERNEIEVVDGHQRKPPAPGSLNIFCQSCSTQVGYMNNVKGGISLFKWAVTVPTTSTLPGSPQLAECISAILTATKARTGSSKALLLPISGTEPPSVEVGNVTEPQPAIYIQILIPAITYASTKQQAESSPVQGTQVGTPAMKILYRPVEKAEVDKMLEDLRSDVQEVSLAWEEIRRLAAEEGLPRTTEILPAGQREFMKCKVGLLRRWRGSG